MPQVWQDVVVAILVAWSAWYLLRLVRAKFKPGSGCGGCGNCPTDVKSEPTVIPIDQFLSSGKRR